MQLKYKLIISFLAITLTSINAYANVSKDFASQRSLFLQVEADLKKGKLLSYRKHKHALMGYPLYPYLKYELLKTAISEIKHSDLSAFIKTYHDSPLANKLRYDWLKDKASRKLWPDFLKAYDVHGKNDIEMQCNYINAVLQTSNDKTVLKYVPEIWLQGKVLPKACDPVFTTWKQEGKLTQSLLWQRIKLAINNKEFKLARHLAQDLPLQDNKIIELWIRTFNDPHLISKQHYFDIQHPAIPEMIIQAISKIAKTKPDQAVQHWYELEKKHKFTQHHWAEVVKEVGLALSRKFDPNAEKWLGSLPKEFLAKDVTDARLKLAVRTNSWESITKVYLDLPETESKTDKWQYWYARALEMLGNRDASQEILNTLSQARNYYGFLASSRILKPFAFNHEASQISAATLDNILLKPSVIRAHELKQIGRPHVGKSEWLKALENLDDKERFAAAQLANEWEMPNWAIVALSNATNKNDLVLRFPKNFSDYIHREAKVNDIDPEVLFAITRQESAFIPTAKSPVGAMGLMQLMPQTGKELAKINREPIKHHHELLHPEKNIRLGSMYLRMLLDQNQQNHVLAAASYNAGAHRVNKWLPEYDMPVDCWIETIPFKETREYVQNFLTYTVIYQRLLGKNPKMSKYMPMISGLKRSANKSPVTKTAMIMKRPNKQLKKANKRATTAVQKSSKTSAKPKAQKNKAAGKASSKPAKGKLSKRN
jgi:soluble lytic murein transglycosylase